MQAFWNTDAVYHNRFLNVDILPNQEFYLLAAVIDRAVRDAHGDATVNLPCCYGSVE